MNPRSTIGINNMHNQINKLTKIIRNAQAALMFLTAATPVFGNVIGSFNLNGDGTVTYSYEVDNVGGSFDVAAWALEFGFPTPNWNQVDVFSGGDVTVPNVNWFADAGTPVVGQSAQDFLALSPAGDVVVGQSLRGFSFTTTFLPGTITYDEFSATGDSITGTTIGPISTVPEGDGPLEAIAFAGVMAFAAGTRIRCRPEQPVRG